MDHLQERRDIIVELDILLNVEVLDTLVFDVSEFLSREAVVASQKH